MNKNDAKHIAPSVLDEAAEWQVRLSSGAATDHDIAQHMEWLLADPAHVEAEEILAATMNVSSEFEVAARAAFADDFNVMKQSVEKKPFWEPLFSGWGVPQYGIAVAAMAAMLLFTVIPNTGLMDVPSVQQEYSALGDHVENVHLSDGSRVALFAGSKISVRMDAESRVAELIQGRAFFDVTSNKDRPFYVNTAARQVKVVGTRFEVVRGQSFDRVSVNEGLVSVDMLHVSETPEAASNPVLIEPGMVALYQQDQTVPTLNTSNAAMVGAWSEGVLTYREVALIDIVDTINDLFPDTQIRLADERLATLVFSGTLVVSSSEQMARQLGEFLSLDVIVEDSGVELSSR